MNTNVILQLLVLVLLIILSAFFSTAETALTSINRIRLRHLVEEKRKNAVVVEQLLARPDRLLSAILIGNNLVMIIASTLAAVVFTSWLGPSSVAFSAMFMTLVILIFAEITPKSLAAKRPETIALFVAPYLRIIIFILRPLIAFFGAITGALVRLIGGDKGEEVTQITTSELKTMVNLSHSSGALETEERNMIQNIFAFGGVPVKNAMTPRTEIVAVTEDASYEEVLALFSSRHFSRLPVYSTDIDHIIGVLYIKDLLLRPNHEGFSPKAIMRPALFVYEKEKIDEVFARMREKKIQLAVILDEYGGTDGLITMEDLLEEIVGDIFDEFDEGKADILPLGNNSYLVEGTTHLQDVNEALGLELLSKDYASIGGYVVGSLHRFPEPQDVLELEKIRIIVLETDKHTIKRLRIEVKNPG